jgi:hypothetical protein
LKDQYDTLRIAIKDKSTQQNFGSVSFDAETFRDNSVGKQWITLHNSSLSDAFQGDIGRDQRDTPRILVGYDSIPQNEGDERGRTTAKRTKETSQLDRGSHDSRRKRSARERAKGGNLIVKQNKSRVVTHRDKGNTKTTRVEKNQSLNSGKGSNHGSSFKREVVTSSSHRQDDPMSGSYKQREITSSSHRQDGSMSGSYKQREITSSSRMQNEPMSGSYRQNQVSSTSSNRQVEGGSSSRRQPEPVSAGGRSITSTRKVSKRTSHNYNSSQRSPKSGVVGGLEHDQVESEMNIKTQNLIKDFLRETGNIEAEEKRMINKLNVFDKTNARLQRDEEDLYNLKRKAEQDLEGFKNEIFVIEEEEQRTQQDLLRELERLEQEHEDIEAKLEDEQMAASQSAGGKVTVGTIRIDEEEQINSMKDETRMVLDEIKDAILNNRLPIEESSFDPIFREDLEKHANDIIEKETQRYEIEVDVIEMDDDTQGDSAAGEINEASLNYQRNQRDALQKEFDRVTTMYDGLGNDLRRDLDEESRELDELRDHYRRLQDDRDHFRNEIDHLKQDSSMTYSLDAGSGPVGKFNKSSSSHVFVSGGNDHELRSKMKEVEDSETARRQAEIELDGHYDQWRGKIDHALDNAYVKLTSPADRGIRKEITKYMIDNDRVTRSLNQLLADKERLENLLYLRKTNHRLTSTVQFDQKSFNTRMSSIKKEDRDLMDELNKSDNALLSKNTALRELDDKIRVLSRKYADLEAEAQEKKGLISSIRIKHDHIRIEIERLRGLINEDELARMEADLRNKEGRLSQLQAQVEESEQYVVEWREKIIMKQRLVKSRCQSRVLLFEPDPNDPVDQRLADYVLSHVTTVPVKKVEKGHYLFGTRNIEIFPTNQGLQVRLQSGEQFDLDQFISLFHDKELQKLDVLGDNEELVVDEKDDYRYQENIRLHNPHAASHGGGGYETSSHMSSSRHGGEAFEGYDAFRESEIRSTTKRSKRNY